MKVVSIREFNDNISKLLKAGSEEEIIITKRGKAYVRILPIEVANKKPEVATKKPEVATKNAEVATFSAEVATNLAEVAKTNDKDSILNHLRARTEAIVNEEVATKPEWCLQCRKFGKFVRAIKLVEVAADDGWHEVWMCERCARKNGAS